VVIFLVSGIAFPLVQGEGYDCTNIGREHPEAVMNMMLRRICKDVAVFHVTPNNTVTFLVENLFHIVSGKALGRLHELIPLRDGDWRRTPGMPLAQKIKVARDFVIEKFNIVPAGCIDSFGSSCIGPDTGKQPTYNLVIFVEGIVFDSDFQVAVNWLFIIAIWSLFASDCVLAASADCLIEA
jgi:hypothetical protein